MPSQAEIQKEQKREKQANMIAEQVISKTAWGKFYGLMRAAARAGEENIPHKVCVDKNGRVLKVYKSKAGQWAAAFLKPAHEQAARDLSQGKTGRAFLDMLGFGGFIDRHEMRSAKCFVIKPKDVLNKSYKK